MLHSFGLADMNGATNC